MQFPAEVPVTLAEAPDLGRLVPHDAPHQGVVIEVEPLEEVWLEEVLPVGGRARAAIGARPGDRSAQCRCDPAIGSRVRSGGDCHSGPPLAARKRSGGESSLGSAGACTLGASGESRPGARRNRRSGLLADRACWRCRHNFAGGVGPRSASRSCWAPKDRVSDPTRASIATLSRGCRSAIRSTASTFPTRHPVALYAATTH